MKIPSPEHNLQEIHQRNQEALANLFSRTLQQREETVQMLVMWWMRSYIQRVSITGKLQLEGTKWVEGPSRHTEDLKSQNKIKMGIKRWRVRVGIKGKKGNKVNQGEYTKVMKAAIQDKESRYYNPDPLFQLIGESNEVDIQLEGNKLPALIDSGAQVSAMTQKQMKLKVHKLNKLLRIEGTGGGKVPYKGYLETLLEIPEIPDFKE